MLSEETKPESRIEYIDIAKALGIMLVIAGHVVSSNTEIKRILYAFHMPLFFMLSGMLLKSKNEYRFETWRTIVYKKLRTLMLPYFVWALVYSAFSFKHLALIVYGTRETLIDAESLTSLWFLPVMFLAFLYVGVVLAVSSKTRKYLYVAVVVGVVVCFLIGFIIPHHSTYGDPYGLDIAFVAAAFMSIGMIVHKGIYHLKNAGLMVAAAVIVCVVFIVSIRFSTSAVGYVLMANAEYGNPFVFIINATAGSFLMILLSCLISKFLRKPRLLQFIGSRTLGIFVVHKPIAEFGRSISSKVGLSFDNPVMAIIITLITLAISAVVVSVIEHIIPEIIGLKQKQ